MTENWALALWKRRKSLTKILKYVATFNSDEGEAEDRE